MWFYLLAGTAIVTTVVGVAAFDDQRAWYHEKSATPQIIPVVASPVELPPIRQPTPLEQPTPVVQAPPGVQPAPLLQPPPIVQSIAAPPVQMTAIIRPVMPQPPRVIEPEMIVVQGGTFQMGSNDDPSEQPVHRVTINTFLLAKYPVTVDQWRECVQARGCSATPEGDDDAPMGNVSWNDAQQYVAWLSQATQHSYRLPSEAEWEYAARGGTETRFWWGNVMKSGLAVCKGCGDTVRPERVGLHAPNPFGLYGLGGGIAEWVQDCWWKDYRGAPLDGSPKEIQACNERALRGGGWNNDESYVRSAGRNYYDASVRYPTHGLRVARSQ
jgi:formylglycine-generating enzyme required for sulfatase activity